MQRSDLVAIDLSISPYSQSISPFHSPTTTTVAAAIATASATATLARFSRFTGLKTTRQCQLLKMVQVLQFLHFTVTTKQFWRFQAEAELFNIAIVEATNRHLIPGFTVDSLAKVGLNIQAAHAFSTVDGYSLDVFGCLGLALLGN